MVEAGDPDPIVSKRMAICALLPYAIFLEQGGQQETVNAITHAARASASHWFMDPTRLYVTTLYQRPNPPRLNRLITLISPHVDWRFTAHGQNEVVKWAAAASVVPCTEEVSQSVVDTLLQIASIDHLRPHIPIETWVWIKKRPSLPPVCSGRYLGTALDVVRCVRGLGDLEILKSYLLLVWSEWDSLWDGEGLKEMETSVREEFGGIGAWSHREDLTDRLEHVLRQLGQGSDYLTQHNPWLGNIYAEQAKEQYRKLEGVLVDMNRETMDTLNRAPLKLMISRQVYLLLWMCIGSRSIFTCALPLPCL